MMVDLSLSIGYNREYECVEIEDDLTYIQQDPDKNGSHSIILGCIHGLCTPLISMNDDVWVISTDYIYGAKSKNPHRVSALMDLTDIETFDSIIFGLIREHYKLDFPKVMFMTYMHNGTTYPKRAILQFEHLPIRRDMFFPHTEDNYTFRFNMALIIFLAKLMGVPLNLTDIRIVNGIPTFWNTHVMGMRTAKTLESSELAGIFDVSISQWKLIENGKYPKKLTHSRVIENINDTAFDTDGINGYLETDTMMERVISYMRDIQLGLPLLRKMIYLRENEIVNIRSGNQKYPTYLHPRVIIETININQGILMSAKPFDIFRLTPLVV
jgi:hypothetical protein